jgi:SAM-dependent methyltransferase
MSASPLLVRLREHADHARSLPAARGREPGPETAPRVQPEQLAFWQSPIARAAINRRITGEPEVGPETYFARRHAPAIPGGTVLSLRASDAKMEIALLEAGSCERVIGLSDDPQRLEFANGRVPEPLRDRVGFRAGSPADWTSDEPLGAVLSRSTLHREADPGALLDQLSARLVPGGLLFVDEFIGPSRSQWTDRQLEVINRLLGRLPDELVADLSSDDGDLKRAVARPDLESWIAANPDEAVVSGGLLAALDERFDRVEVCLYGGAVFHQLFSRIMGNFASRPELVAVLMELDAILTDFEVLDSDYVWGVWRRT